MARTKLTSMKKAPKAKAKAQGKGKGKPADGNDKRAAGKGKPAEAQGSLCYGIVVEAQGDDKGKLSRALATASFLKACD